MRGTRFPTRLMRLGRSGAVPMGRRPNAIGRPRASRCSANWRRRAFPPPARMSGSATVAARAKFARAERSAGRQRRGLLQVRRHSQLPNRLNRLLALSGRGRGELNLGFAGWQGVHRAPGKLMATKARNRARHRLEAVPRGPAVWLSRLPESVKPFLAVREAELCCPTCKAKQTPSLECRRCKCDLSLVVAVHDQLRRLHATVLRQLAAGNYAKAVGTARSRYAMSPDPLAARLLAVCCLLQGSFSAAQRICGKAADRPRATTGHVRW